MRKVEAFIQDFIRAEYEALVAQYTERDEAAFQAKRAKLKAFFANGTEPELSRIGPPDEDWFAAGERMMELKSLAPRVLFQVKAYRHPEYGRLYRAYLSSIAAPRGQGPLYFKNYFIAERDGQLKIVSHYDLDIIPDQEGDRLEDGGLAWIWTSGDRLRTLGELEDSRKFQPPDDPAQRAEYEA